MNQAFLLELQLVKKDLLEALVKQINKDVVEKMDQDVELLTIDIVDKNSLDIKGRAGAMGISKEFVIHSELDVSTDTDMVSVKVKDIEIQGGFLVRKGFALVENMIREKIENSAKVDLGKTLQEMTPVLPIPKSDQGITVDIDKFDLSTLEMIPDGEEVLVRIELKEVELLLGLSPK